MLASIVLVKPPRLIIDDAFRVQYHMSQRRLPFRPSHLLVRPARLQTAVKLRFEKKSALICHPSCKQGYAGEGLRLQHIDPLTKKINVPCGQARLLRHRCCAIQRIGLNELALHTLLNGPHGASRLVFPRRCLPAVCP